MKCEKILNREWEKNKNIFPHLGVYESGAVILFFKKNSGICVFHPINKDMEGEVHCESFTDDYKIFDGKIILSN